MPIDLEKISNSNSFSCTIQTESWLGDDLSFALPSVRINAYRNLGIEVEQEILKLSTLAAVTVENWQETNQFRVFCSTEMRDTIAEELYRCLTQDHGLTVERRERKSGTWTTGKPRNVPFADTTQTSKTHQQKRDPDPIEEN